MPELPDNRPKPLKDADPAAVLNADIARKSALEMRSKGLSYRKIALRLGVSAATAFDYVNDGWARLNDDSDELRRALRCIEDERLEELLDACMPIVLGESVDVDGSAENILKAVQMVLRISHRKAQLFGLDAPKEIRITKGKSQIEPLDALRTRVKETIAKRLASVSAATN